MYYVRELERHDLAEINKWRNDKELMDCIVAPFRYVNGEVDEAWFDNYLKNRATTVRLSIVSDENLVLGVVYLTDIDRVNRSACLGIMIGDKENRGKGIGTFAVTKALEHAFNNLNLHSVNLYVLNYNTAAIGLYKKMGFKMQGTLREAAYKNGKYVDLLLFDITKTDYIK